MNLLGLVNKNHLFWIICFMVAIVKPNDSFSQKVIDTNVIHQWTKLYQSHIGPTGKFAAFKTGFVNNNLHDTLVILATNKSWQIRIANGQEIKFLDNERFALFTTADSLGIADLIKKKITYLTSVTDFELFEPSGYEFVVFKNQIGSGDLVFYDPVTAERKVYKNVSQWSLSPDKRTLIIQQRNKLMLITSALNKTQEIWSGADISQLIWNKTGHSIVFLTQDKGIYYTDLFPRIDIREVPKNDRLEITGLSDVITQHSKLLFFVRDKGLPSKSIDPVVRIWSYTDDVLKSVTEKQRNQQDLLASYDVKTNKFDLLQPPGEIIHSLEGKLSQTYVLTSKFFGSPDETYWRDSNRIESYLTSIDNGQRVVLTMQVLNASPNGKYLLGVDKYWKHYYCYNIQTSKTVDITEIYNLTNHSLSFATWTADDQSIILSDGLDLIEVDPSGRNPISCLTNYLGNRKHIRFKMLLTSRQTLVKHQEIILTGFNDETKDISFYQVTYPGYKDPVLLSTGAFHYEDNSIIAGSKAKNAKAYVLSRESSDHAANSFYTNDFKSFLALSNISPEAQVKWYKTKLIKWETAEGQRLQGILYYPQNLDTNRKYPVIVHYYEKKSDELNYFKTPELMSDGINIPWFVSRDYVVFVPDIEYQMGKPGESALKAIVASADRLALLAFVDTARIGLQGHSFGGYETLYIITHTKRFAAAMAASASSDLVSEFGGLWGPTGGSKSYWTELGQGRLGATPWEKPDSYINNSPVFFADKVVTPLLLMNNKEDGHVPFAQGIEFFTAMRRLQKRCWLLEYPNEVHSLLKEASQKDYSFRLTQFFNHYLKNTPAPLWMTHGASVKVGSIITGYQFDPAGNCAKDCMICKDWNERFKKDPVATKYAITQLDEF